MIQANELRIGNLVNSKNDGIISITNISEKSVAVSEAHCYNHIPVEFISPIRLTEEWLLKFGYDLITENHYAISGHLIWICNDLFICDKNGIILKHVHQLQNLYFALTGCELESK